MFVTLKKIKGISASADILFFTGGTNMKLKYDFKKRVLNVQLSERVVIALGLILSNNDSIDIKYLLDTISNLFYTFKKTIKIYVFNN